MSVYFQVNLNSFEKSEELCEGKFSIVLKILIILR